MKGSSRRAFAWTMTIILSMASGCASQPTPSAVAPTPSRLTQAPAVSSSPVFPEVPGVKANLEEVADSLARDLMRRIPAGQEVRVAVFPFNDRTRGVPHLRQEMDDILPGALLSQPREVKVVDHAATEALGGEIRRQYQDSEAHELDKATTQALGLRTAANYAVWGDIHDEPACLLFECRVDSIEKGTLAGMARARLSKRGLNLAALPGWGRLSGDPRLFVVVLPFANATRYQAFSANAGAELNVAGDVYSIAPRDRLRGLFASDRSVELLDSGSISLTDYRESVMKALAATGANVAIFGSLISLTVDHSPNAGGSGLDLVAVTGRVRIEAVDWTGKELYGKECAANYTEESRLMRAPTDPGVASKLVDNLFKKIDMKLLLQRVHSENASAAAVSLGGH